MMTVKSGTVRILMLTGLAALLGLDAAIAADLTPFETEQLAAPLSPNDPRAQLDPALRGVPNMAPPAGAPRAEVAGRVRPRRGVSHDLETGETRRERPISRLTPSGAEALTEGEAGFAAPHLGEESAAEGESDVETVIPMAPQPEVVWGSDDRVRITPTTSFPWRTVTKLYVTFPNNKTYGCSGSLIAAKYVLTNGHCVFSAADGGWARRIEVVPGFDNGYKPYGSAFATRMRSVTGWTSNQDPAYDYALVTLDRLIGNTVGWLGYGSFADGTLLGRNVNLSGYPGDKCGAACQYYDFDPILAVGSLTINHRADTFNGQSGSGMYIILSGARYVVGPHRGTCTAGATSNCGPRINSSRFDQIRGWIASGI